MGRSPSTDELLERLTRETGLDGRPRFAPSPDRTATVRIEPDEGVAPCRFRPDPLSPGVWRAHPNTARALRRDILVQGEEWFDALAAEHECHRCGSSMDLQFWELCPRCGAEVRR